MAKLEIQLGADSAELLRELNRSEQAVRQWAAGLRGITAGINFNQLTRDLLAVNAALLQQRAATEAARTSTQQQRTETERYRTEQARLRAEIDRLRLANAQNRQQTQAAAGSYTEAQQRLTALGQAIKNAAGGFTNTTPAIRQQIAEYARLNQQLKDFDKQMGNHQREVGNYGLALGGLSPIFGRLDSALSSLGGSLTGLISGQVGISALGAAFKQLAAGALAFIATPLGATLLAVGSAFALFQANKDTVIQFDAGLKNVAKTTGLAGPELEKLSKEIINTSRSLKTVSTDKLLEYATVAGQLGVKGRENISNFAKSLSQLEIASNLKGEEGATQVARFLTLVDGGVQNVQVFGDELVNLGNNFAATEKEIVANAEAISQNVGIYKIGRQDILAYATATKALGIEAELVGSTFNRVLAEFEKAIRTGKGVENILKIVGGTSAQLSARFKTDASGVFQDYIKGLNGIFKAGGSVNEALEKTGVIAVRDQRVIATLASSGYDTLAKAMLAVRDSNGAMTAEFDSASGKIENQIKRIGIAWDNIVLSIENGTGAIGRASKAILEVVANTLEGFNALDKAADNVRKNQYDKAIAQYEKNIKKYGNASNIPFGTSVTGNVFISEADVKAEIAKRKTAATEEKINNLRKVGVRLAKDIIVENKVTGDVTGSVSRETEKLNDLIKQTLELRRQGTKASKDDLFNLSTAVIQQKALLDTLKAEYDPKTNTSSSSSVFSNGGTTTEDELKKRAKRVAEIYNNLNSSIKANEKSVETSLASGALKQNAAVVELAKKSLNDYQKAWEDLVKLGFKEGSKELKALEQNIIDLKKALSSTELGALKGLSINITPAKIVDTRPRDPYTGNLQVAGAKPSAQAQQDNSYINRAIRSSITSVINDTVNGFSTIGQRNYDIEKKYSDMRVDATQEQIALYTQLERLEKSISTGLISTVSNVFQSINKGISDIFVKGLSDNLSKKIAEGDFKLGPNISQETSKAIVAGAQLAGGLISGLTSPTSAAGQGIGGAISGAGTGAALATALGAAGPWGAIAGGVIGAISGIFGANARKKQEELQKKQVELQKKQLEEQKRTNALAYTSSIIGQMTSRGVVTGFERDALGNIVARIDGKDIVLAYERTKNGR